MYNIIKRGSGTVNGHNLLRCPQDTNTVDFEQSAEHAVCLAPAVEGLIDGPKETYFCHKEVQRLHKHTSQVYAALSLNNQGPLVGLVDVTAFTRGQQGTLTCRRKDRMTVIFPDVSHAG